MIPSIDLREGCRAAQVRGREAELRRAARAVSAALPGSHEVHPRGLHAATGTPRVLESAAAEPAEGSHTERALAHLRDIARALGMGSGDELEFFPDPAVVPEPRHSRRRRRGGTLCPGGRRPADRRPGDRLQQGCRQPLGGLRQHAAPKPALGDRRAVTLFLVMVSCPKSRIRDLCDVFNTWVPVQAQAHEAGTAEALPGGSNLLSAS